jgi:hypothetical protein
VDLDGNEPRELELIASEVAPRLADQPRRTM